MLKYKIFTPGFVKFVVCRCDRLGGGLCIYIKNSIVFEVCLSYSKSVCELLIVKLLANPSDRVLYYI